MNEEIDEGASGGQYEEIGKDKLKVWSDGTLIYNELAICGQEYCSGRENNGSKLNDQDTDGWIRKGLVKNGWNKHDQF